MIHKKNCINCAAYNSDKKRCQRHAPPWHQVESTDWCGEWIQKPVEVEYAKKVD